MNKNINILNCLLLINNLIDGLLECVEENKDLYVVKNYLYNISNSVNKIKVEVENIYNVSLQR